MITEAEIIQITNSYLNVFYKEWVHKVKIPVYKKKWKLWLLDKLVSYRKKRAERIGRESEFAEGISNMDYSKIICPDSWINSHTGYIAIGVNELKYVYVMDVRNAFLLENIKYGMRPIGSYDYSFFSRPMILIDKDTREIYDLGGELFIHDKDTKEFCDFGVGIDLYFKGEKDFNNYKENKVSKINWSKYIKKMSDTSL